MKDRALIEIQRKWHGSWQSYLIGFFMCLFLTGTAYFIVLSNQYSGVTLLVTLSALAILQAIAQLLFFLHVSKEPKPYLETIMLLFMILVIVIIVFGSLWIMYDLNYRGMQDMPMKGHAQ